MKTPLYRVLFTKEAKKNIGKLDSSTVKFVRKAIQSLSANPVRGKPLAYDLAGLRSLRTSDYRVIYRLKERELLVIVVALGHRREIYKKLKELLSGLTS
ncbi:MAG: type II toxin-antitoxin system RelE/ParE family toxin [Candidatus Aminicenantes bacterium]|nr:type II toxin-antitoxin system RelE/ParE family toxin [Candidatus Aminicenantes bacterium]